MATTTAAATTTASEVVPQRRSTRRLTEMFWHYVVMIAFVLIILVPIIMMLFGSLKTGGELVSSPYTPPIPPHWENFTGILTSDTFWLLLRNSLIVMFATTAGVVTISALAAFVFARMQFKARTLVFNILTLGLMFPLSVAILPEYILLRQLHMLNLWGVIMPEVAFGLAGNVLILRSFFTSVPFELQDASYVDGCNDFGFFWRILLPLARPALGAVAVLAMVGSWNELFLPLVVLDSDKLWTLPLGTMQFMGDHTGDWALVLAFVTLTTIPAVIFYIFAERQIVSGLTAGAVKG